MCLCGFLIFIPYDSTYSSVYSALRGIALKNKPLCNGAVPFLMRFITSHLRHLKRLISRHLRPGEIGCSRAAEFGAGNAPWRMAGERLSGPLNGLHFRSTPRTAGSNYDGIKITCSWVVSSKQQFRDPLLSSINESLKMHLCRRTAPASQL